VCINEACGRWWTKERNASASEEFSSFLETKTIMVSLCDLPRQARDCDLPRQAQDRQKAHLQGIPDAISGARAAQVCQRNQALPAKNGIFEPFIYKNDHFTKTGSGQT
jgi:hypothetical protein